MNFEEKQMNVDEQNAAAVEKKEQLMKKLQERSDERQQELSRKKEESEKFAAKNESQVYFLKEFDTQIEGVRSMLQDVIHVEKDKLTDYFDDMVKRHMSVQKFLTDSALFLTSHEVEQKQAVLNTLFSEITSTREELLPKKKFAFKNKKKQTAAKESENITPQTQAKPAFNYDVAANEYRVTDHTNTVISLSFSDVEGKDVAVSKLKESHLSINGVPSAVHLSDVDNCTILCGPCARSIFIERCKNTTLVLACQQLRIHEAVDCTFYIHVTSKAIIEDSTGLKFAPYSLLYPDLDKHYELSGLKTSINNWSDVDDFNWLVKDKQSPNWSILPETDRQPFTMS